MLSDGKTANGKKKIKKNCRYIYPEDIYIVTFAYEKILRKFEVLFLLKGGLYRIV